MLAAGAGVLDGTGFGVGVRGRVGVVGGTAVGDGLGDAVGEGEGATEVGVIVESRVGVAVG